MLVIKNFTAAVDNKVVIHTLSLTLKQGTVHALMGPNGAGKSSLAYTLMGHPDYNFNKGGSIKLNNRELINLAAPERAQAGLFLAFQNPIRIEGVSVQNFLKSAYEQLHCAGCKSHDHCPHLSVSEFRQLLTKEAASLNIPPEFLSRSLNDGFSGGEKKRLEILQLLILKPLYAILDETDSGLDIDSLKLVAAGINRAVAKFHTGVLLITHYQRILDYITPGTVSILVNGVIVKSGGPELVAKLEKNGYQSFTTNR